MSSRLGQAEIVAIGTAVANVAVGAHHAVKVNRMQKKFQKHLSKDEANMDFVRNIVSRFKSLGTRLVHAKQIQPGTQAFEDALKQATIHEMIYKGYCNADIYAPQGPNDRPGERTILGKFTRAGHVDSTILPKDAGPIWASGCKNAQDEFRYEFVNKYKGGKQFTRLKYHKEDIGVTDLFLRYGSGLFIVAILLLAIKIQKKVIKHQKP